MKNKKSIVYSAIALLVIALAIVGATYAYFQNQYGDASNADVNVTTYTTDVLTFETGDAINITADQTTFAEGKGNQSGSSFTRATLQANNKTNTATANYYVYLNIESNTFTYTKKGTPELILQVIDKATGNPVTSITGLDYVTVTDGKNTEIKGFDITDKSGIITLLDNKEISASPKTVEEYIITITLVNHNYDQNTNAGKNLSGKLIIQKDKMNALANICDENTSLTECIISQYTGTQGENGIYYHNSDLTNGAEDNSYRYAGASDDVKNYICLGSNEVTCPEDNLYRIIGVFGDNNHGIEGQQLVKVIKSTSIGDIEWNTAGTNKWANASLNETLNTTFKTEKLSGIEDKIADVTWRVRGYRFGVSTAKEIYTTEITNATTKHTAKIGLMYPSDYGFATTQDYWTTNLSSYEKAAMNKDWLYLGSNEWTLSPMYSTSDSVFNVTSRGLINTAYYVAYTCTARPSFYLLSSVNYVSGDGSVDSPIRIS